jgi:hypothetical protein
MYRLDEPSGKRMDLFALILAMPVPDSEPHDE